jgi:hypothetical protein
MPLLVAFILVLLTSPASAREVFLLVGQSNISGRGELSQLPAFPNADRVVVYRKTGIAAPAIEPVSDETGAGAGPALAFADRLAEVAPSVRRHENCKQKRVVQAR